jgi:hypothetical protein
VEYVTFSIIPARGGSETLRFPSFPRLVEYVTFSIIPAPGGSETLRFPQAMGAQAIGPQRGRHVWFKIVAMK